MRSKPSPPRFARGLLAAILSLGIAGQALADVTLLNVSYDPSRELYQDYNAAFAKYWKNRNNGVVTIKQSHGGSGKQARSVIDGLEADVVTLALAYDVDALHEKGKLIPADWQKRLPHNAAPYTSTIVFLVRKGNPKKIRDWNDLAKPGIEVITPNPKTSGGARWNYLAAWGYALKQPGGNDKTAQEFVGKLLKNAPLFAAGGRDATTTFMQRRLGDVLVTFESEAELIAKEFGKGDFEVVYPSLSVLAEFPVAVVEKVVDKKNSRTQAKAYLDYLWSKEGQEVAAQNYLRPRDAELLKKYGAQFPTIKTFTVDDVFGGWSKAVPTHFKDGGSFDQIYQSK